MGPASKIRELYLVVPDDFSNLAFLHISFLFLLVPSILKVIYKLSTFIFMWPVDWLIMLLFPDVNFSIGGLNCDGKHMYFLDRKSVV